MEDNIWKVILASVTSFLGYCIYGIKRNNARHDKHDDRICILENRAAVAEEQMKHVLVKLNDVLELGDDLKQANKVILRALARKH